MTDYGFYGVKKIAEIEDPTEMFKALSEIIPKIKDCASQTLKEQFDEKGFALMQTASLLEIDAGGLSKRLRAGFSLPINATVYLSHTLLHQSVQDTYLGFFTPTILPKDLSSVLSRALRDAPLYEDAIFFIDSLYEKGEYEKDYDYRVKDYEIVRERLIEISEDRGVLPTAVLGDVKGNIYTGVQKLLQNEEFAPTLFTIAYYALNLGTSMDYFTARDYTGISLGAVNPVKLFGSNKVIRDKKTLTLVSKYLKLTREDKNIFLAHCIAKWLSK